MTNPKIISALQAVAAESDGVLIPEQVVEAARSPKSILHSQFCWDDDKASHLYRVFQARQLIRTVVRYVQINGNKRAVRVFVSLIPDREEEGGGYRDVITVLADKGMRTQMLEDALAELRTFEVKYAHLKELAGVFQASKAARNKLLALVAA